MLVPNLMPKKKYVVHYLNLKFYLVHAMRLPKVHSVIKFAKEPWMEPNISMNSTMRAQAKNEMAKDLYKLWTNAVYSNSLENQSNRTDIHLSNDMAKAAMLLIKQICLNVRMFHENLMGVEMKKVILLLSNPSFVNFVQRELTKLHMMRNNRFLFPFFSTVTFPPLFPMSFFILLSSVNHPSHYTLLFTTLAHHSIYSTSMY